MGTKSGCVTDVPHIAHEQGVLRVAQMQFSLEAAVIHVTLGEAVANENEAFPLLRRSNGLRAHCGCRGGNRHLGMRRVLRRRIHSLSVEREREAGKGGKSEEGLVHEGRCVVEGLFSHVPQPKARSKGSPLLAAGRASPQYFLFKPSKPFNTSSY